MSPVLQYCGWTSWTLWEGFTLLNTCACIDTCHLHVTCVTVLLFAHQHTMKCIGVINHAVLTAEVLCVIFTSFQPTMLALFPILPWCRMLFPIDRNS